MATKKRKTSKKKSMSSLLALLPIGSGRPKAKRNPGAFMVNPAKNRRRRRRNPAGDSIVSDLVSVGLTALVSGGAVGFIDSKIGNLGFIGRSVVKVGMALGGGFAFKRLLGPRAGLIAMAVPFATLGHETGVKLGGGLVAMTKKQGVAALLEAAADDEEIAALLDGPPDEEAIGQGKGYMRDMKYGAPTAHPYPELAAIEAAEEAELEDGEMGDDEISGDGDEESELAALYNMQGDDDDDEEA
jgi:hypothetical protein